MLVVSNRIPVADGSEAAFLDEFERRTEGIQDRPGIEHVELLRPVEADVFVIQATWESRDAFERWRESDAFREAHADLPDGLFDGPNQLEIHERVTTIG